jgi:hypothetical protein
VQEVKRHTALDQNVIKTLLYYDIFNYPLKAPEVYRFLRMNSVSEKDVVKSLDALTEEKFIHRFGDLYCIHPKESLILRRLNGNKRAEKYLSIAAQKAKLIARFPFVRGVFASGSLSKNYMDETSDLDFFIITAPERLWICRTLLVLYKRLFLRNSHKYFCVNYFIDSDHLEIEEKNLFTATELATVVPLIGSEYYLLLHEKNSAWLSQYFPNFRLRDCKNIPITQRGFLKQITEGLINFSFANAFEKFFMNLTLNRWERIYRKKYDPIDFSIAFKSKKYTSKNHPRHFQKQVIERYYQKIKTFSKTFDFDVSHE